MGYRQVVEYVEGKQDWKVAGIPWKGATHELLLPLKLNNPLLLH